MSQIITVKRSVTNIAALKRVCDRRGVPLRLAAAGGVMAVRAYDAAGAHDPQDRAVAAMSLPGWKYEAAVRQSGTVAYDNYKGFWGEQKYLDQVLMDYAAEVVLEEMAAAGYSELGREVNAAGELVLEIAC